LPPHRDPLLEATRATQRGALGICAVASRAGLTLRLRPRQAESRPWRGFRPRVRMPGVLGVRGERRIARRRVAAPPRLSRRSPESSAWSPRSCGL
jgi:hypothetical protein